MIHISKLLMPVTDKLMFCFFPIHPYSVLLTFQRKHLAFAQSCSFCLFVYFIKRNRLQISPNNMLDLKSFNIISGHIPTLEHIFLLYIPTELLCVPTSNIFHISKIHKSIPEQFELNTLLYFYK